MSLNPSPLEVIEVRDPRTIITNKRQYGCLKSGQQTTFKQCTTTNISSSSISFSCPPPNTDVIIDRKILVTIAARITINVTANAIGVNVFRTGRYAPRALPISSSIETLTVNINNQSISTNLSDILPALQHYNSCDLVKATEYYSPAMPDQSQSYDDLLNTFRNPLGAYGDSSSSNLPPRGAYPFINVVQNPISTSVGQQLTGIIDIQSTEPLLCSPLIWGKQRGAGLYGVNSFDVQLNFLGNAANRWLSYSTDNGAVTFLSSSISFTGTSFQSSPTLSFQYITPMDTQIIPKNLPLVYPFFQVERYPTDYSSQLPVGNVSIPIQSNNIQLSSVPRRMYLYVRLRNQDLYNSPVNTDTFARIDNVNIQFMNQTGLLSSASVQQLYEISVSNHCNMSFPQFYGYNLSAAGGLPGNTISGTPPTPSQGGNQINGIGSVVCIEFAKDISLPDLLAPGVSEQIMLQVTVNCTNLSYVPIFATFYIVTVLEGTFTIHNQNCMKNIGVLTKKDVLYASQSGVVNYHDVEEVNGGDFFSSLKDLGNRVWTYIKPVHDFVKDHKLLSTGLSLIPQTKMLAPMVSSFGYGEGEGEGEGYNRRNRGGVLIGGASMSRNKLHQRLMK